MNNIKYIFFDIGGVIVNIQKVINDLAALTGKTPAEFDEMFEIINRQASRGLIDSTQLWKEYESTLFKKKTKYSSYIDFCENRVFSIPETYNVIHELSKSFPIGIISNIEIGIYELLIEKNLIPDIVFSSIIKSCDIGYSKPEKEIYDFAEGKASVSSEEILFIDDRAENLIIPQQKGWKTVLFDSENPVQSVFQIRRFLSTS